MMGAGCGRRRQGASCIALRARPELLPVVTYMLVHALPPAPLTPSLDLRLPQGLVRSA